MLAANVTVHSVAVTIAADDSLDRIARETGGLSFFFSDSLDIISNALNEAFSAIEDTSACAYG